MLHWPHGPFEVLTNVLQAWRAAGQRSRGKHTAWQGRVAALPVTERAEFERVMKGALPANWQQVLLD